MSRRRLLAFLSIVLLVLPGPLAAADEQEPDYSQLSSAELERVFFDKLMDGDRVAYRNMNVLVWKPHYSELVKRRFGCLRSNASGNADKGWTLARDVIAMLGGPPDRFRIVDDRYIVGSACRGHYCPEEGIMIADLRDRRIAFGLLHYVRWAPAGPKYWDAPIDHDGYLSIFVDPEVDMGSLTDLSRIVREWSAPFLRQARPVTLYAIRCDREQ